MKAGALDRTVTLFEPAAVVDNGYTEKPNGYETGVTRKARLVPSGAQEAMSAGGVVSSLPTRFEVRSDSLTRQITAAWKLTYNSRNYDIVGVTEMGRNEGLVIEAVTDDRNL